MSYTPFFGFQVLPKFWSEILVSHGFSKIRLLPSTSQILHVGLLNPDYWENFLVQSQLVLQNFNLGISSFPILIVASRLAEFTLPQAGIWPPHGNFGLKSFFTL